jgi:DNA-binding NtrC family response regulator
MPGLDGVGLLGSVKREFPNVARLVHSSSVSVQGREVGRLAVETLRKPARPVDVVRAIERALQAAA